MRLGFDAETLLKLLEQFFLLGAQAARVGEAHLRDKIAFAASVNVGNPFTAKTVLLGVFGPRFELQGEFAREGRDRDIFAQNRLRKEDRDFEIDIVAVADEMAVLFDVERDVQIASHAAFTRIAASRYAKAVARIDPGRDFDRHFFFRFHEAFAFTVGAFFARHRPLAVTRRTRLREGHEALAHIDLPLAAALRTAGDFALFGAGSFTAFARGFAAEGNLFFASENGLFETDAHLNAHVERKFVALGARLASAASAAEAVEHLFKDASQIVKSATSSTASHTALQPFFSVSVINRALIVIAQNLIRFVAEFEFVLRFGIVWIAVGMIEFGHFAVGFFDLVAVGASAYL